MLRRKKIGAVGMSLLLIVPLVAFNIDHWRELAFVFGFLMWMALLGIFLDMWLDG